MTSPPHRYDPWQHLQRSWPGVAVVIEQMTGDLLGEVRHGGRLIALRAGTSDAQRRCTLAHEIVHLERGLGDCGQWQHREETLVHDEAARRMVRLVELAEAIRSAGDDSSPSQLAQSLDVDTDTVLTRLRRLRPSERAELVKLLLSQRDLWALA